ncbi:hypothetical protein [Nonomuraea maheshkhaliensis]|uniref:hypothetical protein n=1 Tax=Nonomuraea maheshkhaliensis TaxID=419590 RepID=UPI0031FA3EBC
MDGPVPRPSARVVLVDDADRLLPFSSHDRRSGVTRCRACRPPCSPTARRAPRSSWTTDRQSSDLLPAHRPS